MNQEILDRPVRSGSEPHVALALVLDVSASMSGTNISELNKAVNDLIQQVKEVRDIPCAIGFGISTPEQAEAMAKISDGAIVGSAIVKIIAEHGRESVPYVAEYVKKMKEAMKASF